MKMPRLDRNEDPDPDWQPVVRQLVAARMARITSP